jgi:hypothetical protein
MGADTERFGAGVETRRRDFGVASRCFDTAGVSPVEPEARLALLMASSESVENRTLFEPRLVGVLAVATVLSLWIGDIGDTASVARRFERRSAGVVTTSILMR